MSSSEDSWPLIPDSWPPEVPMFIRLGIAAVLLVAAGAALPAQPPPSKAAPKQRPQEGSLKVGDPAPAVAAGELDTEKMVRLADLRGRPAVLIFGSCT